MKLYLTTGEAIIVLRHRLGLTQRALARKAGISRNTLREVENDRGNPYVATIAAIARALGVAPATLLLRYKDTNRGNSLDVGRVVSPDPVGVRVS